MLTTLLCCFFRPVSKFKFIKQIAFPAQVHITVGASWCLVFFVAVIAWILVILCCLAYHKKTLRLELVECTTTCKNAVYIYLIHFWSMAFMYGNKVSRLPSFVVLKLSLCFLRTMPLLFSLRAFRIYSACTYEETCGELCYVSHVFED
jgi:hypothetical protein